MNTIKHLYIHVPFCPTICPFCSFHVLQRRGGIVDTYLDALDRDLARCVDRFEVRPDTIYVGGGTPSYLKPHEIEQLVRIVDRRVGWNAGEVTIEVHPSTATEDRVSHWVDLGFNRLSVGIQSFDDAVLATLGRPHDAAAGRATLDWCTDSGATVSLDLMSAVPGQNLAADLEAATAIGVDHVAVYTLTIEAGTPFDTAGMSVDNAEEATAIELTASTLTDAGYRRYEVSNYARPGSECRHNQAYWSHQWFLGVGPSAASFLPGPRHSAVRATNPTMASWIDGASAESEVVGGRDLVADALLCGLRQIDGIDPRVMRRRSGLDPLETFADELQTLASDGLLVVGPTRIRPTPAGLMLLDLVAGSFMGPAPSNLT